MSKKKGIAGANLLAQRARRGDYNPGRTGVPETFDPMASSPPPMSSACSRSTMLAASACARGSCPR